MANQSNSKKNILNIVLFVLVGLSVILILTQIFTDAAAEVQSQGNDRGYSVQLLISGDEMEIISEPTPTPFPTPASGTPEATPDPLSPYYDPG